MKFRVLAFAVLFAVMMVGLAAAQTDQKGTTPVAPKKPDAAQQAPAATQPSQQPPNAQQPAPPVRKMTARKEMKIPDRSSDIIKTAQMTGEFSLFLGLIHDAGLTKTLEGKGPFTLFAPTDAAMSKIPSAQLDALKGDRARLMDVLKHHIIEGKELSSAEMTKISNGKLTPMGGNEISYGASGGAVAVGGSKVVGKQYLATNGVIHAIDKLLIPPAAPAPEMAPAPKGK